MSSVYLRELHWHCISIADRRKTVDQLLASTVGRRYRLGDEYVIIKPALLTVLTEIILAASNIKKLINPDTERRGMTKAAHDYLLQRAQSLSSIVAGLPISEIHSAKTRNALEHFDRELDKYIRQMTRQKGANHKVALLNVTLSSRNALNRLDFGDGNLDPESILFLRGYIVDTSTFIAFDEEINIGQLCFEAELIEKRVRQLGGDDPEAGQIIPLPQLEKDR